MGEQQLLIFVDPAILSTCSVAACWQRTRIKDSADPTWYSKVHQSLWEKGEGASEAVGFHSLSSPDFLYLLAFTVKH